MSGKCRRVEQSKAVQAQLKCGGKKCIARTSRFRFERVHSNRYITYRNSAPDAKLSHFAYGPAPALVNPMGRVPIVLVCLLSLIVAARPRVASWAFLAWPPCGLFSPPKGQTTTPHFRPRDSKSIHSLSQRDHVPFGMGVGGLFRTKKRATTFVRWLQGGGRASTEDGDDGREACNVIVTGANRGLGFAIAERMVLLGHRTVLACRSKSEVSRAPSMKIYSIICSDSP